MSERPAILLILMFMVNDKQPFKARLAALYCVQCFLFKNQKGQARIVSTLLPNQEGFSYISLYFIFSIYEFYRWFKVEGFGDGQVVVGKFQGVRCPVSQRVSCVKLRKAAVAM